MFQELRDRYQPAPRDLASCQLSIIKFDPCHCHTTTFTLNVVTYESEQLIPNAHLQMTGSPLIWTVAKSFKQILQQTLAITDLPKCSLVLITHFII